MISLKDIKMAGTDVSVEIWLRSVAPKDKQIVTEAVYECLRRNWPVNLMEIGYLAREMRRKALASA